MINLGLIGAGIVGEGHLAGAARSGSCRIVAVADIRPQRVESLGQAFDVPHRFTDYRDLLALPGLDGVIVATHLDTHCSITLEALQRGLHVLCEKPMARSTEECQRMCDAADQAGKLLAINFNTRSSSEFTSVREAMDRQPIGQVRVMRCVYIWSAHHWQPIERMNSFMAEGGPIVDSGVHFFDAMRWFSGQDIAHIHAVGATLPEYEHPQHVVATCRMADGAIGIVEVGWLYTKNVKDEAYLYNISVIADDATIDYESITGQTRCWTKAGTTVELVGDSEKHFEVVHQLFAQSIRVGRLVQLASGMDGLKATQASFDALRSAHQNNA